jgi:hypothetical protein
MTELARGPQPENVREPIAIARPVKGLYAFPTLLEPQHSPLSSP